MLFNSYAFVLGFLPITLAGYFVVARWAGHRAAGLWLTLASLFFYAWWNPRYLILILVSIILNYWVGVGINRARKGNTMASPELLLTLGVFFNLGLLGYYKYANFLVNVADSAIGADWTLETVILPLAISFFTFTQIAYLVDAYHGVTEAYDFLYYALFVSFFPHLIAGPIVFYRRLMPQFSEESTYRLQAENLAAGLSIFCIGLSKKVLIADNLSALSTLAFDNGVSAWDAPFSAGTFVWTWLGVLGYTFQLYFDFSGYSDMAIGLGRMFNVRFPLNFNSPYKAADISDFWRRWHISLSEFLRDHLYIPLGGNRHGESRRYLNLILTMLLGGLWHGAGWTFVIWGGLHGFYLVCHHLFQKLFKEASWLASRWMMLPYRALTFLAVIVGWIFFRSHGVEQSFSILAVMSGEQFWRKWFYPVHSQLAPATNVNVAETGAAEPVQVNLPFLPHLMHSSNLGNFEFLALAAAIAFFAPNVHELFRYAEVRGNIDSVGHPLWKSSVPWAIATTALLVFSLLNMANLSEFLYFKF